MHQRKSLPLPKPRPTLERLAEIHLHLYGLSSADIPVILDRRDG